MKFPLEILSLFLLVAGTLTQDFDLADALDDVVDPEAKPEKPAATPPKSGGGLNLLDALGPGGGTFSDADLIYVVEGDYKPDGGWQSNMIQKLGEVLKNQRQQIEMLSKLLARVYKK